MAKIAYTVTSSSFTVWLDDLDEGWNQGDRVIQWYVNGQDAGTQKIKGSPGDTSYMQWTISNCTPNSIYYVSAIVKYGEQEWVIPTCMIVTDAMSESSGWSVFHNNFTANPMQVKLNSCAVMCYKVSFYKSGEATFYIDNIKNDSEIDLVGYVSTGDEWYVDGRDHPRPVSHIAYDDDSNGNLNFRITCMVQADTIYYVWISRYAYYKYDSGTFKLTIIPPSTTSPSLSYWSWDASNGNASALQTSAAYRAIVDKTSVKNFSYLVWNDMVDKVKEILDESGIGWSTIYDSYANTKMTSSDKTLTAKRFNSLLYNIDSNYSTGISEVKPGYKVLGSYFKTLASCINGWIDTL